MNKFSAVKLALTLAILFLCIHFGTEYLSAMNEASMHGVPFVFSDFVIEWLRATFENLQSEMWQLALQFALLAGALKGIHVIGYEEDNEEMKKRLDRIERKQDDLSNMQKRGNATDVRFP